MDALEAFKGKPDGTSSNLVKGKVSLPMVGRGGGRGLELDYLKGPFQPKPFYDSMITLGQQL